MVPQIIENEKKNFMHSNANFWLGGPMNYEKQQQKTAGLIKSVTYY